jgi:subtilisin family serine protease
MHPIKLLLATLIALPSIPISAAAAPAPERVPDPDAEATPRFHPDQLILRLRPELAETLRAGAGLDALGDVDDPGSLHAVLAKAGALGLVPISGAASQTGPPGKKKGSKNTPQPPPPAAAPISVLDDIFLIELEPERGVLAAVAAAAAHPDVVFAEPNLRFEVLAQPLPDVSFVPDDPFVTEDGQHWSEGAWGQIFPDLWGLRAVRALEAWSLFDEDASGDFEAAETRPGEGIVVAVIDTGLDRSHRDIAPNAWIHPGEIAGNGIDDDGNGFVDDVSGWDFVDDDAEPDDRNGHGTHVAGTIAARVRNATDVAGVAPWARIMPVKALDENGIGFVSDLVPAVRYAADNGANILSNSWGGLGGSPTLEAAFEYVRERGAIAVASAGNASAPVAAYEPASFEGVIAVAAIGPDDVRAPFSNYGRQIALSAPGIDVLSLNANAGDNTIATVRPDLVVTPHALRLSGTSMACPHVSGAIAVIWSRFPDETATEIRGRLLAGAEAIDAANPGFEERLGAGRVDVEGSLLSVPHPVLVLRDIETSGLFPGGETAFSVRLVNEWAEARSVEMTLVADDPFVTVLDGHTAFGDLPPGAVATHEDDPFRLQLASDVPFGHEIVLEFELRGESGLLESSTLRLHVTFFQDTGVSTGLPLEDFAPWRVSIRDYDGDDLSDVLFVGYARTTLHRNLGDVRFTDATVEARVFVDGFATSDGVFADVDNDGDQDLFVGGLTNSAWSHLFMNDGGVFTDETGARGVRGMRAANAIAFDYDRDGQLDFFGGSDFNVAPDSIKREANFLLHNLGDGHFEDVILSSCIAPFQWLLGGQAVAFDYDGDGDADLLRVSVFSSFRLYRNEGDGRFTDVTRDAGLTSYRNSDVACEVKGRWRHRKDCDQSPAIALAVGDIDNDADLDIFVTGRRGFPNALFRNDGRGRFSDVTAESGDIADGGVSGFHTGNDFFDFDNDGDLDLYVTNDGTLELSNNVLYRNEGEGIFRRVTDLAFPSSATPGGGAAGVADFNGDGALDVYAPSGVLGVGLRGALFLNRLGLRNHWIKLRLVGVASNRDAYGARVLLTAGGTTQLREVHTSSVETQPVHFGLGAGTAADTIEVRWPSGLVQRLYDVAGDTLLTVVEPAGCLDDPPSPGCADVSLANPPTPLPEVIAECKEPGRPDDLDPPGSKVGGPKELLGELR